MAGDLEDFLRRAAERKKAKEAGGGQTGKLHILDYYKLENVSADTEMRKALAVGAKDTHQHKPTDPV